MSGGGDLLDALPDAVVVLDGARRIEAMNTVAEQLTGWSRDTAVGRSCSDVMRLVDAAGFTAEACAPPLRVTTGTPEREYVLQRTDGTERHVAVRASFERDSSGRVARTVIALRDIARRRRIDSARADLVAMVSHEIRSPLTSVKGFTSTLLHRWERFTDEQKRVMLETINHDADRVTRLLTDLLNVSRLDAGRLELKRQEIDVRTLASDVVARLSSREEAAEHTLAVEMPETVPLVMADPNKIDQVITNLVENAFKYSTPGRITVSAEDAGDRVVVRVADEGEGIDAKHLPHIFTKFYRRGTGERHAGTGLGLYICKGIVEAHGGAIWVERSGPDGTTFAFTLPKEAA